MVTALSCFGQTSKQASYIKYDVEISYRHTLLIPWYNFCVLSF